MEPEVTQRVITPPVDPVQNELDFMMERLKLQADVPPTKPVEQNFNFMMEKIKLQQIMFERMVQWQKIVQDRFAIRLQHQREAEQFQQIQHIETERLHNQHYLEKERIRQDHEQALIEEQVSHHIKTISIDVTTPPPVVVKKKSSPSVSYIMPQLPMRRQFKTRQDFQKAKRMWLQWHSETSPSPKTSPKPTISPVPFDHMVLVTDYLPFYAEEQIDPIVNVVETVVDTGDADESDDEDIVVILQ